MRIARRRHLGAVAFIALTATLPLVGTATASTVSCEGADATIVGTPGNDVISGTPGPDVIHGLGGNDVIRGRGGDDIVCGGGGNDTLIGGPGDDQLLGGPGADRLIGNAGIDTLVGHGGRDWLRGGTGADRLNGNAGADRLSGQQGPDVLSGGPGDDRLIGNDGSDILRGSAGDDLLDGGSGDDELDGEEGADTCRGDEGSDTARHCETVESTERGIRPRAGLSPGPDAVALTFDDGPHPWYTPTVLDILDAYDVKATFFVLGVQAASYPDLVTEIAARGHSVQNHTCNHLNLPRYSVSTIRDEIRCGSDWIEKLTGTRPACFRPPYGATSGSVFAVSEDLGEPVVLWDVDTQDYARPGSYTIARRALAAGPGDTILMHDAGGYRSQTVAALPTIIEGLRARGLEFDTLCG